MGFNSGFKGLTYFGVRVSNTVLIDIYIYIGVTVESTFLFMLPDDTSLARKYNLNKGHTIVCYKVNVYLVYKTFLKLYSALWDHWQISFILL